METFGFWKKVHTKGKISPPNVISCSERTEVARIFGAAHFRPLGQRSFDLRCILKIARTEFCPRRASRGSGREGGKLARLRRENFKLPKNLKTKRLELYFVRAKEIFHKNL